MSRLKPQTLLVLAVLMSLGIPHAGGTPRAERLPEPNTIVVDRERGEVILSARVEYPEGRPCIDEYGDLIIGGEDTLLYRVAFPQRAN